MLVIERSVPSCYASRSDSTIPQRGMLSTIFNDDAAGIEFKRMVLNLPFAGVLEIAQWVRRISSHPLYLGPLAAAMPLDAFTRFAMAALPEVLLQWHAEVLDSEGH